MSTQTKNGYMLIFRGTDWHKGLSPEEMQKVSEQWMAWFKRLTEQGKAVAGNPLEREGKTVSGKNGRVVADGPFAESKEAIGGYFLLNVATWTRRWPSPGNVRVCRMAPRLKSGRCMEQCPLSSEAARIATRGGDGLNSQLVFPPHSAGGPARNLPTIKIMSTTKNKLQVGPYLFFDGRCEEAIEFYRKALGAEVDMLMRFKDSPEPPQPGMHPPGSENKVMHANLRIGETQIMASDGRCGGKPHFDGFALSITVPTEAEADRRFTALADGGKVQMPLARTFFSPRFGMVTDRFGVLWMIIVQLSGPPTK